MSDAYAHVLRIHAEDASFLWSQWRADLESIDVDREHGKFQERRLALHLAALTLNPSAAWPVIDDQLELYADPSDLFVATWLAIESEGTPRLAALVDRFQGQEAEVGLLAAMQWSRESAVRHQLREWVMHSDPLSKRLVIAACRAFHIDPRDHLRQWLADPALKVRAEASALAGMLGRADLLPDVISAMEQEKEAEPDILHAAALLHAEHTTDQLIADAASGGRLSDRSALLFVISNTDQNWRSKIRTLWEVGSKAHAVRLAGLVPGSDVDRWLVEQMSDPNLIRAAGNGFATRFALEREASELFTSDLNDLPPDVASGVDADQSAPFPVAERIEEWLASKLPEQAGSFVSHRRLMITSYENALAASDASLEHWCSPTFIQLP